MDANDSAKPIDLEGAKFDELLAKSNLYVGHRASTRRSTSATEPSYDKGGKYKSTPFVKDSLGGSAA